MITDVIGSTNNDHALIFNIQRFSLQDGPGIRTLVFFKGCLLRCLWCSNPESQKTVPELMYDGRICQRCGKCIAACPFHALRLNEHDYLEIKQDNCTACGSCTDECSNRAITLAGDRMSAAEVFREICRDRNFYQSSGGGITLGGGEPLLQPAFVLTLLKMCRGHGIHTAMETAGFSPWKNLQKVSPYLDLIYYDIKHINPVKHQKLTGVNNRWILNNLSRLAQIHPHIIVRYPLIREYTDNAGDLMALAQWVKQNLPKPIIELSPYYGYGEYKYQMLGRCYLLPDAVTPPRNEIDEAIKIISSCGVQCRSLRY